MLNQLKIELELLANQKRLVQMSTRFESKLKAPYINFKNRDLLDFTSWDFLALDQDQRLAKNTHRTLEEFGFCAHASRLSTGNTPQQISCEKRLAKFLGTENSLLFSSKNQVVLSLITSLCSETDCIFVDELIQSPILDSAYLVNCNCINFDIQDLEALAKQLASQPAQTRKFIIYEAISPITGLEAPNERLLALAQKYSAHLIIDESYSLAAVGQRGAGSLENLILNENILCKYGSLAQGFAAYAGFIAGSSILIDYLINRSRTFHAEVAPPPILTTQIESNIDAIELKSSARVHIGLLNQRLRNGLNSLGLCKNEQLNSAPFTIINFEKNSLAIEFQEALIQKGFFCDTISPNLNLGKGAAVRFIINALHTEKHIDDLLQAVLELYRKVV